MYLISATDGGGWIFFLSTSIPSLIIILIIKSEFRESAIYKIYSGTGGGKIYFYTEGFILYLLMFIFLIFSYNIAFFIYGSVFNLFLDGYWFLGVDDFFIIWFDVPIKMWLYFIASYSLLNYVIYLLIYSTFKTNKNRILVVISLAMLSIPFGGAFNNVFHVVTQNDSNGYSLFKFDSPFYVDQYYITWFQKRIPYIWQGNPEGVNVSTSLGFFEIILCPWSGLNQLFVANVLNHKFIGIIDLTEWNLDGYGLKIYSDNIFINRFGNEMWHDNIWTLGEIEMILLILQPWLISIASLMFITINKTVNSVILNN